jgi:tagatose-1,6-bisphosphate aldolase
MKTNFTNYIYAYLTRGVSIWVFIYKLKFCHSHTQNGFVSIRLI